MIGHCAKKTVTCEIVTLNGDTIRGENLCRNPRDVCPRNKGEGYDKCISICQQIGHAEIVALQKADCLHVDVRGATAIIRGIGYSCRNCQEELYRAGVKYITCIE